MINSTIFETNLLYMSPKSILLIACLLLFGQTMNSQYTEKINTNRPGRSQGAFSVGNNVLQGEGGFGYERQKHKIRKTKTSAVYLDYAIRYGLLIEQLEINFAGRFRTEGVTQTIGTNEQVIRRTDFEYNTLGVKYLIYDPYKRPKENDSLQNEKLKSWKKTYAFSWKSLIPAVSAYVGANYITADNPFTFVGDATFSPKIVVMTQNNWWNNNAGSWVLVTNLIIDKITTDNPAIGWFITSTHTLNDKWAIFGEYQGQKSDFYSDNILRLGSAYLVTKDLQLDAHIATNFKDTPSIFNINFGASYRFDWHSKDEIILPPGLKGGVDEQEGGIEENEDGEGEDLEGRDSEFEEIESDSLKQERTPFINDFEDGSHREAMEQDLDERRTEQRIERERIEQEKVDKKNEKKARKEERRRLKREAKEAKDAEKARLKAEKEKQKMIEDIDAELNLMEDDDGEDKELKKLEEEIKQLEKGANTDQEAPSKKEKEDEDIDAAYEKLQKEEAKFEKEEQKRLKEEEKRRQKEEKRRQKEEKKRQKEEEKRRKKEESQGE